MIEAESSTGVRGMDDEAPAYTLDEALACLGFGKFQGLVLAYAGLGWFAEAMELMLLSFVGPTVKSQWDSPPAKRVCYQQLYLLACLLELILGASFQITVEGGRVS